MYKPLLIISTGRCVWEDLEKVKPLDRFITMAVNYMIIHWPWHLDFAVSLHEDFLSLLVQLRTFQHKRNKPTVVDDDHYSLKNQRFKKGGIVTSGMYAICIGLYLGYDKIVVVGTPFDASGHFYDPPKEMSGGRFSYAEDETVWEEVKEIADNRVRVLSGDLTACFGEYTEEWLEEEYEYVEET